MARPKHFLPITLQSMTVGDPIYLRDSDYATRKKTKQTYKTCGNIQTSRRLKEILDCLGDGALKGKYIENWSLGPSDVIDCFFPEIRLGIHLHEHTNDNLLRKCANKYRTLCKKFEITLLYTHTSFVLYFSDRGLNVLRGSWRLAKHKQNGITYDGKSIA